MLNSYRNAAIGTGTSRIFTTSQVSTNDITMVLENLFSVYCECLNHSSKQFIYICIVFEFKSTEDLASNGKVFSWPKTLPLHQTTWRPCHYFWSFIHFINVRNVSKPAGINSLLFPYFLVNFFQISKTFLYEIIVDPYGCRRHLRYSKMCLQWLRKCYLTFHKKKNTI